MITPKEFKKELKKGEANIFIVDTNVWVYAANNKVDLRRLLQNEFGLAAIYVPDSVVKELKKIRDSGKKEDGKSAWLSLQIIERNKLHIVKLGEGHTDKLIAQWALKNNANVLTNDLKFRYMLKGYGIPIYCLRQKRLLQRW